MSFGNLPTMKSSTFTRSGASIFSISARIAPVRGRGGHVLARQERREEGAQPVVVLLEDRVVLVIVAAGAGEAEAEDCVGGDVGDLIEHVVPLRPRVALVVLVDAVTKVARR